MARPLRIQVKGASYHIFSRGNLKQDIFSGEDNKAFFLKLLRNGAKKFCMDIFAYCIMDNHYHLSLRLCEENLPEFMHFLGTSYANYLVRKGWVGHVFSGRYKSILLDKEEYFLVVNRYIHLNPVEAGIVQKAEEYPWSNYRDCIRGGNEGWLEGGWLTEYFGPNPDIARARYRQFVEEDASRGSYYPESKVVAQALLGSDAFLKRVRASIREAACKKGIVGRRALTKAASLEEVHDAVCEHLGFGNLKQGDYRYDEGYRYACWLFIYMAREYTAASSREIAGLLDEISGNAVFHRLARMKKTLNRDGELGARFEVDEQRVLEKMGL